MLFSIQFPQILSHLGQLAHGLQPVKLLPDGRFCLIIKVGKEAILTARLNRQVKIYIIPDLDAPDRIHGFITAFFDDHDEPMVIFTPLFADDELAADLGLLLKQGAFDLYFFDEHDREMFGVCAVVDAERFGTAWSTANLAELDLTRAAEILASMSDWFGLRTEADDDAAFTVDFEEDLYTADLLFIDARPEAADFAGANMEASINSLERSDPGAFQERDIALLLRRAFPADSIFLNPIRDDTRKELTDILCVTDDFILVVQAKDSPNTEQSLRRSIDRKRSTIRAHIKKGAAQLRGAIKYILERDAIVIREEGEPQRVAVAGKYICGLVIVREMFDDDHQSCSSPVLAAAQACEAPTVLLEYQALHTMALRLPSPERLMSGLFQLFDVAIEKGEYPKPRFLHGSEEDNNGS
tara:strand:+ start:4487 stop:5722 length:1236 start_codon:yes stop_codon:yes gene_type:complete